MTPICFIVMSYGRRRTGLRGRNQPRQVDCDALWTRAFAPALQRLGYEPVRADQDFGGLLIGEMMQRLALSDLVIADVSVASSNVYYEIGVRHAANSTGCVLLAAKWATPAFDLQQIPRIIYPLEDGEVGEPAAAAVRGVLEEKLLSAATGTSPVHDSIPGYPDRSDEAVKLFRERARELARFQSSIQGVRDLRREERRAAALEIARKYQDRDPALTPGVALEVAHLLRNHAEPSDRIDYLESLPRKIVTLPLLQEQLALARSESGDHHIAIEALRALIELEGDSPERRGLLGGRYKRLMGALPPNDPERTRHLDRAIEEYQRGSELDLNDYYPASNLSRLYRERGGDGDEQRAREAAILTRLACDRARALDQADDWTTAALLGVAFGEGNVDGARQLAREYDRQRVPEGQRRATLDDLQRDVDLQSDAEVRRALAEILRGLESGSVS